MMFRYVCVTLTFELLMYIHLSALLSVYMNMLKVSSVDSAQNPSRAAESRIKDGGSSEDPNPNLCLSLCRSWT